MTVEQQTKITQCLKEELVFNDQIQVKKIQVLFDAPPNTKQSSFCIVDSPNKIAAIAYDPYEDVVALIESCRIGTYQQFEGPWHLEVPNQAISAQHTHDHAMHELVLNTTKCEGLSTEFVADFYTNPTFCNEKIYLYCVGIDSSQGLQQTEAQAEFLPILEAFDTLAGNYFKDGTTILALHWLSANHERLKKKWR